MGFEAKEVIKTFGGLSLGDKVRLKGTTVPPDVGKVVKFKVDGFAKGEMGIYVELKNSCDYNHIEVWGPIYLDQLEKVEK